MSGHKTNSQILLNSQLSLSNLSSNSYIYIINQRRNKAMFKIKFRIKWLFIFFLFCNNIYSQEGVGLRGQYLLDNSPVAGVLVKVYEGNSVIAQTATNRLGKFFIELEFRKTYVIQFKKRGIPIQKILVNTEQANDKSGRKPNVIVFSLKSSQNSKEGPDPNDVVTSFTLNDRGVLQQNTPDIAPVELENEEITEELMEELEEEVEEIITTMPQMERPKERHRFDELKRKRDSIILLAEQKASKIISSANERVASHSQKDSVVLLKPLESEVATVKNIGRFTKRH